MKLSLFDICFGLLLAAAGILLPFLHPGEALIQLVTLAAIWAIFAIGFDFVFGALGMVSFGHATFLGVGGYAVALATQKYGLPFSAGVGLAVIVGAAFALLFSFFALRVSGIFFALVTLALSQLIFILADSKLRGFTGGSDGISGVERPGFLGIDFYDPVHYYWFVLGVYALVMLAVISLRSSPFGRVIAAIRGNETRADQLGFNVNRYKQITFVISGGLSGLAGALLASLLMYMNPQMLHWTTSGDVIIMTLVGGSGSLWGATVGVIAFEVLKEWLSSWTEYWYGVLGLVFILATIFFPRGIVGELEKGFAAYQKNRRGGAR
ncbi:branched-chain amino acid ABC transporter permease [Alicycliphilus denitrificans]|uniref:ABC-type transporter, integral membrane subunit n=2 Tax=Alicycliphilus denitrificans TaxID=179636 RepID=F4G6N5_ALIDK|nr:branched-chain amino acid ABC transporter permease [Alicycliphilus denitrificans]ADU99560.1 inner-membrane translocator [Alicycliphilus denitrificans BC]AEB85426.1 ABC-type transporter, integral membrane subunit [Alicycliphilus denitrificans K601]QKD43760.1 branched-chain amino acid ABC transporter permease [Alicycliphilus denitrificans]GAO21903.1 ABC transporter permease [Alicycliphilus sp. B1]